MVHECPLCGQAEEGWDVGWVRAGIQSALSGDAWIFAGSKGDHQTIVDHMLRTQLVKFVMEFHAYPQVLVLDDRLARALWVRTGQTLWNMRVVVVDEVDRRMAAVAQERVMENVLVMNMVGWYPRWMTKQLAEPATTEKEGGADGRPAEPAEGPGG